MSNGPRRSIEPSERLEQPSAVLEVCDLHIEFGGVRAVDGVSFSVAGGEMVGLIGPNGAGKSTAMKMIAGTLKPSAGEVRFCGQDITGRPVYEVARLGVIRTFQLSTEFARLTLLENLVVAAAAQRGASFLSSLRGPRYWRSQQNDLVDEGRGLLDQFGLLSKSDEYAGTLSGGQKRLLELARALMAKPRLLVLDEPLAGVNPTLRLTVEEHLLRLRDEGLTMIMVEHELGAVERCCESVVVMASGRVLAQGKMADMRANQEVVDAYLVG